MLTQEQESIVQGILDYSLKPYAKMNNIDIVDLINDLYIYHNKVSIKKLNEQLREPLSLDSIVEVSEPEKLKQTISPVVSDDNSHPKKRGRGRPKGSKNKTKQNN